MHFALQNVATVALGQTLEFPKVALNANIFAAEK